LCHLAVAVVAAAVVIVVVEIERFSLESMETFVGSFVVVGVVVELEEEMVAELLSLVHRLLELVSSVHRLLELVSLVHRLFLIRLSNHHHRHR